jgi:hypothetical protein
LPFSTRSKSGSACRSRKLLKRGSFTSMEDLQTKVFAFIDDYNRTMAKPFKWTNLRQGVNRLNFQQISTSVC